jgi:rubrerythrin
MRFERNNSKSIGGFMQFKGSKTENNLLKAFAGESQARNRYTYFASAAKKEGLEQISAIFLETAENEKEHAKVFFKHLQGGEVEITAVYPAGAIKSTSDNLLAAAEGEKTEWTKLYADFEKVAKEEGFSDVAESFKQIAKVERFHEARYRGLEKQLTSGGLFRKDKPVKWHCRNCGYVVEGKSAPENCPACKHPKGYYEILAENY